MDVAIRWYILFNIFTFFGRSDTGFRSPVILIHETLSGKHSILIYTAVIPIYNRHHRGIKMCTLIRAVAIRRVTIKVATYL